MPIVTLLEQPSDASYREALTRGALSAAPRGAACEHIVDVVRAAVEGRTLLPAKVSRALAEAWLPVTVACSKMTSAPGYARSAKAPASRT